MQQRSDVPRMTIFRNLDRISAPATHYNCWKCVWTTMSLSLSLSLSFPSPPDSLLWASPWTLSWLATTGTAGCRNLGSEGALRFMSGGGGITTDVKLHSSWSSVQIKSEERKISLFSFPSRVSLVVKWMVEDEMVVGEEYGCCKMRQHPHLQGGPPKD